MLLKILNHFVKKLSKHFRWSSLEMQCNLNQTCVLIIDGCEVNSKEDFSRFNSSLPMFSKYKFLPPIEVELPPSWYADYGKY